MPDHLTRWLLTDGTLLEGLDELLKATSTHLRHMGIPVDRCFVGTVVPHPQVAGIGAIYEHPTKSSRTLEVSHERFETMRQADRSPMGQVFHTGRSMRAFLEGGQTYQMEDLLDLSDQGYTDYLACPLKLGGKIEGVIAFSTMRGGGFEDEQLTALEATTPALTSVIRHQVQERVQLTLLKNYLGADAGTRVHTGDVRRGDSQNLRAAILLADLRGYTAASSDHQPEVILSLLNEVFEVCVRHIQNSQGQVLKFLGDGLLAIFSNAPANIACDRALKAAQFMHRDIAELNQRRLRAQRPALELGVGLHYGDVLYGNMGAPSRMDFTVIGSAVNIASRIENLASILDERILTSKAFAQTVGTELKSCGTHPLKGIRQPVEVFTIP